jgi:hypothetical protein
MKNNKLCENIELIKRLIRERIEEVGDICYHSTYAVGYALGSQEAISKEDESANNPARLSSSDHASAS